MSSFLVQTLGCKLNQLESEAVTDSFLQAGFASCLRETLNPSVVIINTCAVTSKADQKARRVIRKCLRDYPDACVLVTGCYAQLNREDLLKLETAAGQGRQRLFIVYKESILDLINHINYGSDICEAVREWEKTQGGNKKPEAAVFQFNPQKFSSHTRSFLKIQDGCDNHCTYCKIRLARGASVSLDASEVLSRLGILEQNHAEAVLTGVNICQYRDWGLGNRDQGLGNGDWGVGNRDWGVGLGGQGVGNRDWGVGCLAELLEYLINNTEKIALRLSSLAPDRIDEKLCSVLAHSRIRPHFHLSVQSCSKKILERMGRSYNGETVQRAVCLLRGAKRDPFITCDIIAGFPGETGIEFEETFEMIKKLDFAWIHVFPYSKRDGTPAFSFSGSVSDNEVIKRVQLFTDLAWQGRAAYVRRWAGREVDVLIEDGKKQRENYCRGITDNYLKTLVRCKGKIPPPGTVLRCRILEEASSHTKDSQNDIDAIAQEV
ncbi:MAG: MiaB/RimO family radical SAM methylthiotransferase [Treponema sp.]|nr:MiaB/RimO family radical SAM methylthiotransferase [Treponema sp.]